MPAPLVVAGLWTAGRWLVMRAAPAVISGTVSAARWCASTAGKVLVPSKDAAVMGAQIQGTILRTAAATGAVELATGGVLSREVFPRALHATGSLLSYIPFVGDVFKSAGASLLNVAGDILSLPKDMFVNTLTGIDDLNGNRDRAVLTRIGAQLTPDAWAGLMLKLSQTPEGERTHTFVEHIQSKSGATNEEMINYFSRAPGAVAMLAMHGVDLNGALPGLNAAIAARAVNPSAQTSAADVTAAVGSTTVAFGGAAALREALVGTENLKGEPLKVAFDKVGSLVDNGKVDLGWGFGIVRWIADKLGDLPLVGDLIRGFAMDLARGQVVGMTTGATGIQGPGIVQARPSAPPVIGGPEFLPAPA